MPPTTQTSAGANALSQNAYNQGQQLQNQYNTQSQQDQGQYGQAYNQANQSQSALTGFTHNMINGNQLYGQNLAGAQQMYGFDPRQLLMANKNLAQTQDVLNNLPQAISQQGNYSGATAGSVASNYANQANNVNGVLGNQTNAVNAYQNVLAATQQQANQQTGQALTGQGQQLAGYTSAATNATGIMNNALQTMNNIEQLAQSQGTVTAGQIAQYQNAYSQYVSAQAAQTSANAQAQLAQAQTSEAATQQKTLQNTIDQQNAKNKAVTPTASTSGVSNIFNPQHLNPTQIANTNGGAVPSNYNPTGLQQWFGTDGSNLIHSLGKLFK